MQCQKSNSMYNVNQPNFKKSIEISRINNEPNVVAVKNAISEAVDTFAQKAKDLGCPLFRGVYIDPVTKMEKIIIGTGDDSLYFQQQRYDKTKLQQKINEIDNPLLQMINDIKQRLKTPNVENAVLIQTTDDSGNVIPRSKENIIEIGVKKGLGYMVYQFEKQIDGNYISTQRDKRMSFY